VPELLRRLREFRAVPARVAALVPPAALVAAGAGPLRAWLESAMAGAHQVLEAVLGATQQKAAAFGERAHTLAELAAGQKVSGGLVALGLVATASSLERPPTGSLWFSSRPWPS
jgi:hypothetical protein